MTNTTYLVQLNFTWYFIFYTWYLTKNLGNFTIWLKNHSHLGNFTFLPGYFNIDSIDVVQHESRAPIVQFIRVVI